MKPTRHEVLPRAGRSLSSRLISENSGIWRGGWRRFAIGGAMIAACTIPIVWAAVTDPAQLLLLLPCAVMMLVCMKGMSHQPQTETTRASAPRDAPAGTTSEA